MIIHYLKPETKSGLPFFHFSTERSFCPSGWHAQGESCFQLNTNPLKSWAVGQRECRIFSWVSFWWWDIRKAEGSHLPCIYSFHRVGVLPIFDSLIHGLVWAGWSTTAKLAISIQHSSYCCYYYCHFFIILACYICEPWLLNLRIKNCPSDHRRYFKPFSESFTSLCSDREVNLCYWW